MRHMTKLRLPHQADLLVHLDFRGGKCWDEVSAKNVTVSGTGAGSTYTRHGEAVSLTAAGSDYIDTEVDAPVSGTVISLYRDTAGAGVLSPVWSDGFADDDESIKLEASASNSLSANFKRVGGSISSAVDSGRLPTFTCVGTSWGDPGAEIFKVVNLHRRTPSAWNFRLDAAVGVDVHLNVSSDGVVSTFGGNEFGFFAMWSRPLTEAAMVQVARTLLEECEL